MRLSQRSFYSGLIGLCLASAAFANDKAGGVNLTVTSGTATDALSVSNITLYVPAGQSPTPFLPAGKFTATFNGLLAIDLRGDYAFDADVNGSLKVVVNGQTVLETTTNGATELSKSIRLGKGATNTLAISLDSAAQGDTFLRFRWKPSDSFSQPIPDAALTHNATVDELKLARVRLGRELLIEHRCTHCHAGPKAESAIPELAMDAPSLEEIGTRRNFEWMTRWIKDPKSLRSLAHMPKLLHGDKTAEDASAIASYLASLKPEGFKSDNAGPATAQADAGKKLFDQFHCIACHTAPDSGETDDKKISLKQAAAKFTPGTLTTFLKEPNAHYAWIHMPRFKLTDDQRGQLAAFIISNGDHPKEVAASTDKAVLEQGKKLVQTSGCLNCHTLKLENQFSTKSLAEISDWKKGCLADQPSDKAPSFAFSAEQREALQAFAATDRASLERHVPFDFALRYAKTLNCRNCHGQFEGFPQFELLGGKLKPEWMGKFIAGEVDRKPRPWLDSQMPGFPKFAELMAKGLAMSHGLPSQTPAEPAIDAEAAKVGNNLVSNPPLGFSCISCHSVGAFGATQVFEAPGVNLATAGERLQPSYFKRWLRNPPLVDTQTKMPAYFDEQGKSPITDVYEGDGAKQINALWQYVRLGDKMPAPKTE